MHKSKRLRYGMWRALKGARQRDKAALKTKGEATDSRTIIIKGRGWYYT